MQDFTLAFVLAGQLLIGLDPTLMGIVGLSLAVTGSALLVACLIGFPVGALIGFRQFRGRSFVIVCLNALMGLPPVVVGLLVYMMLSNAGPLGFLQLLYTPSAMIVAQAVLITPIVAALSRQVVETLAREYADTFRTLVVPWPTALLALLRDGRSGLATVALAGFGRAIAEVGAVIIVGGNIAHVTRVMTTSIALETSKGDLALALALGFVLLLIALAVNATVAALSLATREAGHG
ncbi:ABC transporter permease [Chthonobacter albigriseus]|uniref:ABC transporter permease n=1 Tax=Chthonobacter albigriseus TaxID=1683161 RepID=UPI0015EFC512|nr:ABC transporter permease [Chthonobacter albigriseus]